MSDRVSFGGFWLLFFLFWVVVGVFFYCGKPIATDRVVIAGSAGDLVTWGLGVQV